MIRKKDLELAQSAPISIPTQAKVKHEDKDSYQQIVFAWDSHDDWQYTARWHTPLPNAEIITFPSWQISRVHPGLGYGTDHHGRISQTLASDGQWISSADIHRAAWRLSHGKNRPKDHQIIMQTHFRATK